MAAVLLTIADQSCQKAHEFNGNVSSESTCSPGMAQTSEMGINDGCEGSHGQERKAVFSDASNTERIMQASILELEQQLSAKDWLLLQLQV